MLASLLSLHCSFLDLTNDDSGYDSTTSSSCDDEPLDPIILPRPRRKAMSLSPRRRQKVVHHNESFINSAQPREATSSLSLSEIPWPLPNYETWMNPVDLTTAYPRKTPSHSLETSFSTPPPAIVRAPHKPSIQGSTKGVHPTGPSLMTLNAASRHETQPRPKKNVSFTVLRRPIPEVLRGSAPNLLPSLPVLSEKNPPSQMLLVTHTSPFLVRTQVTTPSPVEKKAESVAGGGAFAIDLLSPSDFSKQAWLKKEQSDAQKKMASVSIMASPIPLDEEVNQAVTRQHVKRHYHVKKMNKEVSPGSLGRNSSILTANHTRTRTSLADINQNKENQHDHFHVDLNAIALGTIPFPTKMTSRFFFDSVDGYLLQ